MNIFTRILILLMLSISILFGFISCTPSVSPEQNDSVGSELEDYKDQLVALQDRLAEAEKVDAQYHELTIRYEELKNQNDAKGAEIKTIQSEFGKLNAKYDDLNKKFDDLKMQYDAIMQPQVITEEAIDQAIFALINEKRRNNGLPELLWGTYLYGWARDNSHDMATQKKELYSSWTSWQRIFWASGYETIDGIANGALTIWATNIDIYNRHILNAQITFGAVATYKQGEVYYITYLGSWSP